MPAPSIISRVGPSVAMLVQTWLPSRCHGREIISTVAPSFSKACAASSTLASTSASDSSQPNPSCTMPSRNPATSPFNARVYASPSSPARWRGSSPSGPASTSNNSAVSCTVRAIGPVWSSVSSIGMMPVYGTSPYVGLWP